MVVAEIVKIDSKGRLVVPKAVRERVGIQAGDTYFLDAEEGFIRLIKAEDPFIRLAQHARRDHAEGRTRPARDVLNDKNWPS